MKRWIVFLLAVAAAAAAADATGDVSRGVLEGLERVGDRIWTTSTGVTVVCGGRRSSSDRVALLIEVQLTAVLDSVCSYLVDQTVETTSEVNDLRASQHPQQDRPKVRVGADNTCQQWGTQDFILRVKVTEFKPVSCSVPLRYNAWQF